MRKISRTLEGRRRCAVSSPIDFQSREDAGSAINIVVSVKMSS